MTALGQRTSAVQSELCDLGLEPELASAIAADFVIHYPLARRDGVRGVAHRLERHGLAPDAARVTASMLLALERLEGGADFPTVLGELHTAGIEWGEALSAALDASRVYRSMIALQREEPERAESPALVAMAMGSGALLVALLARLFGLG